MDADLGLSAGERRGGYPAVPATWSAQLAPRLFTPPARWGWRAAAPVSAPGAGTSPVPARPGWTEPPRPDTSALVAARSKAVSRLVWRVAFAVVATFAFGTYQLTLEAQLDQFGESAYDVYRVVLVVVAALVALSLIRAAGGVRVANRNVRNFEQPYLAMRSEQRRRHEEAVRRWEEAVRRHEADAAAAVRAAERAAAGPQWIPVNPASEPTRVDVFGGDPHRHGWASLLVTFGSSLLSAGQRITVLDLTGQEIGDNLVEVARAVQLPTRTVRLQTGAAGVHLLGGLAPREVAECLGYAVTHRPDGDRREERALATDVLWRVLGCLERPVTFARLAAGVRVLRQGAGGDVLSAEEVGRLAATIGDVDQTEWTTRQLAFLAGQLDRLHELAPAADGSPLWTGEAVSLIATQGGRDDRKELVDRLLVRLARAAMDGRRWRTDLLVVAGADHLGAGELRILSEHARAAKVRLVLMIDQLNGDLERSAGTGGAVCLMKMYNHRDAAVAAEFIGREHRFVLNQLTRQVGTSFTDGGGDSFAANTNAGANSDQRRHGARGRGTGLSDSRGHTWTGTRNWSHVDNHSTSAATTRVHEFRIEPEQLLGMPETAFVLVDNTGQGRRVALADCNPGLCQLDHAVPVQVR